jgi:hypothetical protein
MQFPEIVETRTRSVPAAAALVLLGHKPVRMTRHRGEINIVFAPDARADLDRFNHTKQNFDSLFDEQGA